MTLSLVNSSVATIRLKEINTPRPIQLFPNPEFLDDANGWTLEEAFVASDETGRNIVTILGDEQRVDKFSALSVSIREFPIGRKLKFSFESRSHQESPQLLQIKAYVFDREDTVIDYWITQSLAQDFQWTKFIATFYASPGAVRVNVWIQNSGERAVSVRNPSLIPIGTPFTVHSVEAATINEEALASVIEVNYSLDVVPSGSGKNGKVAFPVPGQYRDQYPISFEIYSAPRSALQSYRLYPRSDGINWICEAQVRVLGPVTLHWRAMVIVKASERHRLQKTSVMPPPSHIAGWLSPTACVQTDDVGIRRKSMELAEGTEDVELFVRRVLQFVHGNNGKEGEVFDSLDAKRALECGGSCTSRANLVAALLRSHGVAARTVVHIPVWGRWMDSHWLVEYWHPGEGWIWLEPSLNKLEPSPKSLVILSVSGTDDENKSLEPDNLKTIMPGAAYLSMPLLSPELERGCGYGTNFAIELAQLEGNPDEFESLLAEATKVFEVISKSTLSTSRAVRPTRRLLAAICSGSADKVRTAIRSTLCYRKF